MTDARIDPRGPRAAAGVTSLVVAVVLLTMSGLPLAAQGVVFALAAGGIRLGCELFLLILRTTNRKGVPA